MMMVSNRRRPAHVAAVLTAATDWARGRRDIVGLVLVGSHARGQPHAGSDIDFVVLTTSPDRYLSHDDWMHGLVPGSRLIRTRQWGPVTERRLVTPRGGHLDVGITKPAWAALPLDPGTHQVLASGAQALHDPQRLLLLAITASGANPS